MGEREGGEWSGEYCHLYRILFLLGEFFIQDESLHGGEYITDWHTLLLTFLYFFTIGCSSF